MPDPQSIIIPKDKWTKVIDNKTTGFIHKKGEPPQEYLYTFRVAGTAAPADTEAIMEEFGIPMFHDDPINEEVKSSFAIDVYVWAIGSDGRVVVDV